MRIPQFAIERRENIFHVSCRDHNLLNPLGEFSRGCLLGGWEMWQIVDIPIDHTSDWVVLWGLRVNQKLNTLPLTRLCWRSRWTMGIFSGWINWSKNEISIWFSIYIYMVKGVKQLNPMSRKRGVISLECLRIHNLAMCNNYALIFVSPANILRVAQIPLEDAC